MKKAALIAVAIALLAVIGFQYRAFIAPASPPVTARAIPPPAEPPVTDTPGAAEESRRLALQDAYADLEKDRLLLNRQLGALQTRLWGRRLPAADARSIQNDMLGATQLLSNPPLLGAFFDVAGIGHERDRVNAALGRLKLIEEQLAATD